MNEPNTLDEQEFIKRQLSRLIIENQSEDGSIDISDQRSLLDDLMALFTEHSKVDENTSDGYHTFKELYDYRRVYNATLFNEWASQKKYKVHKSWKHSDGELCFGGGWFVVVAEPPTGQITNHYEAKYWDDFLITETPVAHHWDGHTPQEALDRLTQLSKRNKGEDNE